MVSKAINKSGSRVAVVGVGYWGKNLVRNFYELGRSAALCDDRKGRVEASCKRELRERRLLP